KLMFKENAPEECIEAGLKDHKECGKYMFNLNAPKECIDAGLTGEKQSDHKKCQKIMDGLREVNGEHDNRGRFNGGDCRRIENSEERLKCYDGALSDAGEFRKEDSQERNKQNFPQPCQEAGALTPEACREVMRKNGEEHRREFEEREQFEEKRGKGQEGFTGENQQREFEGQPPEFSPPEDFKHSEGQQEIPAPPQTEPPTSSPVTAAVIFEDFNNEFLDYYFR
ncbi:MAG: hypothetical protein AABX16_04800, partial [Nanoarchaeota archaeon]